MSLKKKSYHHGSGEAADTRAIKGVTNDLKRLRHKYRSAFPFGRSRFLPRKPNT